METSVPPVSLSSDPDARVRREVPTGSAQVFHCMDEMRDAPRDESSGPAPAVADRRRAAAGPLPATDQGSSA